MKKTQTVSAMPARRVIFCTYPGLYSALLLNGLLNMPGIDVVGIVASTRILSKRYGYLRGVWHNLRHSGLRYLLFQAYSTDLFHLLQPFSRCKSVTGHARRHAIPVFKTTDINAAPSVDFIKELDPDIILTGYFNQLVKRPVMSLARLGCLNVHPSRLPEYKGTDPVFRAMQKNDPEIGITVHMLAETFDSGPVLARDRVVLQTGYSVLHYYVLSFRRAAGLVADSIRRLEAGETGEVQSGEGSYQGWPTSMEVQSFHRAGKRLFPALAGYWGLLRSSVGIA